MLDFLHSQNRSCFAIIKVTAILLLIVTCFDALANDKTMIATFKHNQVLSADSNLENNILFESGSISKHVCSLAMMQAVKQERVKLDQPLSTITNSLPKELASKITVRMLLANRSGLSNKIGKVLSQNPRYPMEVTKTQQAITDLIAAQPAFKANAKFDYEIVNWLVVQDVLETIYNKPIQDILQKEVFEPSGMQHSKVFSGKLTQTLDVFEHIDARPIPKFMTCAGGVATRPADLIRLARFPFTHFDKPLLNDFTKHTSPEESYALGGRYKYITLRDEQVFVSHQSGKNGDYQSAVLYSPKYDVGLAIMSVDKNNNIGDLLLNEFSRLVNDTFTSELQELQQYFSIPGLAVVVQRKGNTVFEKYMGYADIEAKQSVNNNTLFPVASLTKLYSSVLIFRLVEQNKLSLEDPISKYIKDSTLDPSIKVKHLLSHSSQGRIGEQFFYSSRFGLLTNIIERASGMSFDKFLKQQILSPLSLKNTFLLTSDSLKRQFEKPQSELNFAKPYQFTGNIERGNIEYGYSASAGVVTTAGELARFSAALDTDALLSKHSKQAMYAGLSKSSPYGYGIFKQQVQGVELMWAYGQYDSYSSLIVKIPSSQLSVIILANNNLMSDPARLIMGDVTTSLFAISFLKNYVFNQANFQLLESPETIHEQLDHEQSELYRQKLLAQALAESFLARFDSHKFETSKALLKAVFTEYPNILDYSTETTLHNIIFLKTVAKHYDLGKFTEFDEKFLFIANALLAKSPNNPYINAYLANYYLFAGNSENAGKYYKVIVHASNFSPNWYTKEAQQYLDNHQ